MLNFKEVVSFFCYNKTKKLVIWDLFQEFVVYPISHLGHNLHLCSAFQSIFLVLFGAKISDYILQMQSYFGLKLFAQRQWARKQ
jgi:hypothetical protein